MAVTMFDLITQASVSLDANPVSSFNVVSREVEVFEPIYDQAKESELSSYLWNFNTYTEKLARENVTPVDGRWEFAYLPPTNILHLVNVFDSGGDAIAYQYEQGRIFTNSDEAFAKFQRNISEPDMPSYFRDVLVARLAVEAAEPLVGETAVIRRALEKYERVTKRAQRQDTKENRARPLIGNQSRWLRAHYGGSRLHRGFRSP